MLVACAPAPDPAKEPAPPRVSSIAIAIATEQPVASAAATVPVEDPPNAPSSPSSPCPEEMVDVGLACIDRYEAPNERGQRPLLMQSSDEGEKWCNERGKRLCNEDEWVRACRGPSNKPYPYGTKFESGRCNDVGVFRAMSWKTLASWPSDAARAEVKKLDQSEPSGARAGCVSDEGVFDLTGNVAEWVVRTRDNETNYSHVVKGCFWGRCFRVPHEPACDYVNFAHPAGFRSYEMGFRCCKARAEGKK